MIAPFGLFLTLNIVVLSGGTDVEVTGDTFLPEDDYLSMTDE